MTIVVECGVCGRRSGAKDEWAGRSVKCPGCGQKVLVPPSGGGAPSQAPVQQPPAARPLQARPAQARPAQTRGVQARPAQAIPAQRASPAGRPQPPRQPAAAVGPDLSQPMAGGILDLLGDDIGATGGGLGGGQPGGPLGAPPPRRRKSGSNSTLWIVLAAVGGVGALAICGGIVLAIGIPAMRAAREAAQRVQAQRGGMPAAPASSGGLFGGSAPAAPSGPVWSPDANLLGQLPVDGAFDRYLVKLPAGFASAPAPQAPSPPGGRLQNFMWMGQPQGNGTRQVVVAAVVDMNVTPRSSPNDLELAMQGAMSQVRISSGIQGFTNTPGERGQLAGKQFIRSRFSGSVTGVQMHGTFLMMIEGGRLLWISSMCNDGPGTPGYQLLDAALLTFKQR